ncbi:hypothetical protein [Calothrix sp. NIES-2100]
MLGFVPQPNLRLSTICLMVNKEIAIAHSCSVMRSLPSSCQ